MAPEPQCEAPLCSPLDAAMEDMEGAPEFEEVPSDSDQDVRGEGDSGTHAAVPAKERQDAAIAAGQQHVCCAGGRRPQVSKWEHCPTTPQSFVRCGPHHRAELCILDKSDIETLTDLWWRYRDDLSWPWYDQKPQFSDHDFLAFRATAQKVVDAMVEEYRQPMVLDQATLSNTNHVGHPPHADNVQFDSVWWKGKRIRKEDEVVAAQEGAYVLWRPEKTSYRSYSCTVSLCDPTGYEGGEVQFFAKWGDKDPIVSYKCAEGCGVAFCGCQRNIHAVTGVQSGFRLVLLVWTRPPDVRVPDNQTHVCYFRPGTGLGVWLTTADILRSSSRKCYRSSGTQSWVPKDEDDGTCQCNNCKVERKKVAWQDCCSTGNVQQGKSEPFKPSASEASAPTPTTSAGNSPRTQETRNESPSNESQGSTPSENGDQPMTLNEHPQHCPHLQGKMLCKYHGRLRLYNVLTKADMRELRWIWDTHQDDLSCPWYEQKPTFTMHEFEGFRRIAQKVVDAMSEQYREPLVLDQATISNTNHLGHPPHADNVQFDSVWWRGRQVKQKDELAAARGGAEVFWRDAKTSYRNYSATVALTDPSEYGGGDLEFYDEWGQKEPSEKHRLKPGSGVAFCGCQRNVHAVTGVRWGFRLVLLIWTRPLEAEVPDDQKHVCYFRPGTGLSVWLTTADLHDYPARQKQKRQTWVPVCPGRKETEEIVEAKIGSTVEQ